MNRLPDMPIEDRLAAAAPLLEAIVEGGSFAAASERLGVDPSAISHRVSALESIIGFRLFERTTRQVRTTKPGQILCAAALTALANIRQACAAADEARRMPSMRLSVMSSLAMKWLVPRLPDARSAGLDISVDIDERIVDFADHRVDAAIRFGIGPYPGLHSVRLAACNLQPVVSPSLLSANPNLAEMPNIKEGLLLGDTGSGRWSGLVAWAQYTEACGVAFDPSLPVQNFDRADVMLQAVIGGLGVGLGRTLLIEDDIKSGLIVPIGQTVSIAASYWLVAPYDNAESETFLRLRDWLVSVISAT